ncbi:hypothetical protein [Polaribacter sp.]|uniref:hypothetical protein n=1 Tax=Polaribacter sp. TaxID=1920175 RepID=UPI002F35FFEE
MKILSVIAILFGFTQCGTSKLVKTPPFKIASATYNNWVGGLPGVSGTRVEIRLSEKENIDFESLFFKNKSTKIEVREENGKTFLTAHFNTSKSRGGRDLILDSDSRKEIKNEVPKNDDFPFELKENEAVLSYKVAGKIKFYKIENIEATKSDFYPKAKKIN